MKKKTLIIIILIGFLGIISSTLYLFKNTNTTKEKTITNEQTKQNTNFNNNINTTKSGNNLISTGNTNNSGSKINLTGTQKYINKTGNITILMPTFLYQKNLTGLIDKLKKQKITINIQTIDKFEDYRKTIEAELKAKNGADILLIPSDRLKLIKNYSQKLNLGEQITPYFDNVFMPYLDQKKYDFVPYILDPLVTFVSNNVNIQNKKLNLNDILSYLTLYKGKFYLSIPVLWGIDKNDQKLLEMNGESFPNYFSILYNLIYQLYQGNDIAGYNNFLNISKSNYEHSRTFIKYKQLYKKIMSRNSNCDLFPDTCIFAYKFADIKFGYLSDIQIRKKYYTNNNRSISEIKIYNFPLLGDKYKVRGRGFIVPKYSNKTYLTNKFLQEYIKSGTKGELNLRNDTLSPFTNILNIQKHNQKYQYIFPYKNNFSLIYNDINLQNNFLTQTNITGFLSQNISTENFIKNFKRTR